MPAFISTRRLYNMYYRGGEGRIVEHCAAKGTPASGRIREFAFQRDGRCCSVFIKHTHRYFNRCCSLATRREIGLLKIPPCLSSWKTFNNVLRDNCNVEKKKKRRKMIITACRASLAVARRLNTKCIERNGLRRVNGTNGSRHASTSISSLANCRD